MRGYCGLHKDAIDITTALQWDGSLLNQLDGGEQYPAACPLNQRPVTVVLTDTLHQTEKIGRPVKQPATPGRDVQAEGAHLLAAYDRYRAGKNGGWGRLIWNTADFARRHGLNLSHFRAVLRGARPWHENELDAVVGDAVTRWHYAPGVPVLEQTFTRPEGHNLTFSLSQKTT